MSNESSIATAGMAIPAYGSTTISPQALPTQLGCMDPRLNSTLIAPNLDNFIMISPVNQQTVSYMSSCCQGAPLVVTEDGCAIYCGAANKTAILVVTKCLKPTNDMALDGISGILQQSSEPITTTSSMSTPTATTSTTRSSSSSATAGKGANSVLVSLAAGAMMVGWVMNGFS